MRVLQQKIIIKKEDYITNTEKDYINRLKAEFTHTHFSTYEKYRDYLHIEVDGYDGFNLHIEMNPWEAEKMFLDLAEQARKIR